MGDEGDDTYEEDSGYRYETFDRRENEILETLENEPNGLTHNALVERVKNEMAKDTLAKRIKKLRDEGVVEQLPSDEDWERGKPKRYRLVDGARLPDEINWDQYTAPAIDEWKKALSAYDPSDDLDIDGLESLYHEYTDLRPGEPMFEITGDDDVQSTYLNIATELYRFHTEKVFGESYIILQTEYPGWSARRKNWVMLKTYEWANDFVEYANYLWEKSDVPGPNSGGDGSK